MTFFRKGLSFIILTIDPFETVEKFIERGYFILNQKYSNDIEYAKSITHSRMHINISYNGLSYLSS